MITFKRLFSATAIIFLSTLNLVSAPVPEPTPVPDPAPVPAMEKRSALEITPPGLFKQIGKVNDSYNFWLSVPQTVLTQNECKPLVVFLHGSSLCGNNLDRVKRYGTIAAISKGHNLDSYVIAPQNPGGAWKPSKLIKLVDYMCENYNVDPNRVYVLGMSLGGYGTIDLVATYPDRFAAALAMCGGGTVKNLSNLNQVPLWIIHGTADRAVSISESDKVVAAMKSVDASTPRLVYNRVAGMNHSQPARLFNNPASYEWLFSHSLRDKDRSVNPTPDISSTLSSSNRSSYRSSRSSYRHKKSFRRR
ncbi:MAG: prolyl oligopeptidase family serine peptidase [Muribaculaceae bacterium]|nr:prolyl oligopeptidase family serine peptidase [Muribaculaceae bacterium]